MRLQKLIFLFAFIILFFTSYRIVFGDLPQGDVLQYSNLSFDSSQSIQSSSDSIIQTLGTNLSGTLTRIDIKTNNLVANFYASRPFLDLYECDDDTYEDDDSDCVLIYSGLSENKSEFSVDTQSFYINSVVLSPSKYYFFISKGNNMFNALPIYHGSNQDLVEGDCYRTVIGSPMKSFPCVSVSDLYFSLYGISKTISPVPPAECLMDCFSNVLFLPGLMGSKLYGQDDEELWVSHKDSDHSNLLLDNQGKSIDSNIHTKDDTQILEGDDGETGVIDEIFTLNIYKTFLGDLKSWKDENLIKDYAFIPYDWRLSLDDIITNGSSVDGNLSYNTTQDFSESFILKKLEALQSDSKSGKVTIIAHSNGGLVAKALIQKLKDTNNPLYEKIDKVILVAVPQVGTPDAVVALLHGTELAGGLIMYKDRARQISENMPTVYNLLPSESYFNTVDPAFAVDKIASFEDSPIFTSKIAQYGLFVSNSNELKNYVLGSDARQKPAFDDTSNPNIGNSFLYSQAENLHNILDNWEPFIDTKVIQVAGWGVETLAGLDYKTYRDVTEHISYTPRFVIDGDSTVVVPSALWMSDSNTNVERWWVDLIRYNKDSLILKTKHRNILEIFNVSNFIKSKIQDVEFFDPENIIVNNTSTLATNDSRRLHFILHSPLTLGITDQEGNYVGMDLDTNEIREEIPNVDYRQIGEVQFLSVPAGSEYTLKLDGYADGYFSLEIEEQEGNSMLNSKLFEGIPTSPDTSVTLEIDTSFDVLSSELNVDQDGDGNVDIVYPIKNEDMPKVEENKDTDTYGFKKEDSVETVVNKTEENEDIVEPLNIVKNLGNFLEKVKEEEIKKEYEEDIENKQESVKEKDLDLSALAVDSGFVSSKVSYIIILGLLVVLFLIRRFIKI